MAKIKKKGTSGNAKNFITRTKAVRKLQISLPDFRRLCIFKGIYPREPRNKRKASKSSTALTTFYYTKDIQYLLHEPLLRKFRDHKALAKKIGRALGKGEVGDAARLEKTLTPQLTLDHIIKERYPTFVDALRDLDDALSMLFLFANLPSTSTVPPKKIALCQRLCLEFQHYLIISHSLRKSFLSIKGIYYQATIQGQDILWLVPYKFVQRVTGDVDFRIMGTFVEFYTTLLGFVNFRLYSSVGLIYPPKFDSLSDEKGGELAAFTLQGRDVGSPQRQLEAATNGDHDTATIQATAKAQAAADALKSLPSNDPETTNGTSGDEPEQEPEDPTDPTAIDTFTPAADDTDILPQPQISSNEAATLFAPFTFFLSRETPRAPLEFLLRAFGCKRVGWDPLLGDGSATADELDPSITHQIVDRPPPPVETSDDANDTVSKIPTRVPGRIYLQPQWVWDCINEGKLLRPDLYAPGAMLPPHLSPWVKPDASKGEYDPSAPLAEQELEGEAEEAEARFAAEEEAEEDDDSNDSDDEPDQEDSDAAADATADWDGLSPAASDDEAAAYQLELEAEAAGRPVRAAPPKKGAPSPAEQKRRAAKRAADEQLARQKTMMSQKKRKLLESMLHGNARREGEAERLRAKRRRLEREAARSGGV